MGVNASHLHEFSPSEIEAAVAPMLLQPLSAAAYPLLARYLQLLVRWNRKMNLTAVRDPDVLVRVHLAECLRAAQRISPEAGTVLDFGSGAGFPGIPIQIARPELRVTLAEAQGKKSAFLREAIRELGLSGTSVHSGRVGEMSALLVFDLVTLRAVDKMGEALQAAIPRIRSQRGTSRGACMVLSSQAEVQQVIAGSRSRTGIAGLEWRPPEPIPGTNQRVILLGSRTG